MSSITITTQSFGAINSTVTGQAPATIVLELGTPGPAGQTGPQGPAGPTFTGGPITSPITFDAGTNSTAFENGDVYAQDNTSGSYGAIYTGGLQASNGTLTLDITGSGITFGDSSVQSTAFPGSGAFYPSTGNPSGFLTASALTGYATESFVTSQGFLTDAPSDGSQYARQDGAWSVVTGGGGGSYLPLAGGTMTGPIVFDGTSGQYISKGNFDTSRGGNYGISLVCSIGYEFNWQAGWLTTTEQSSVTPRPLYLDSLAGTTLRAWDSSTSLGTEVSHTGITFPDATVQTTVGIPKNGDTIIDNGSLSFTDGGVYVNISYQDGFYSGNYSNNQTVNIYGGNFRVDAGASQLYVAGTGITFPDSTTQTSAAFVPGSGDLDIDGYSITDGNFSSPAGQVSAQNVTLSSGGVLTFGDSTTQSSAGLTDAPTDGSLYARQSGAWASFTAGIGPQGPQGEQGPKGDPGAGGVWGQITGDIYTQTDLINIADSKADKAPLDGNYYVQQNGAWVQCTVVSIYDSNTSTSYNCLTV